jgi:MOSC domain-containing protein YiiM
VGVFVAPAAEAPCTAVERAEAVAGRGLRGDRYFDGLGTFGGPGAAGHELTLIEQEALDELAARTGIALDPADARRNVVTSGVDLNALAGRRFAIGDVEIAGRRWCEPCAHLQRLTTPGVLRGLVHRGGLRADIVRGGTIARGDAVRLLGQASNG